MDNILTARPDNPADRLILAFQDGRIAPTAWAQSLKAQGASYVIVEKTDDGAFYLQQVALAGPRLVYQDSSIALYKLN
jgi:hypothetical protein